MKSFDKFLMMRWIGRVKHFLGWFCHEAQQALFNIWAKSPMFRSRENPSPGPQSYP